jgi:hypothetical protein
MPDGQSYNLYSKAACDILAEKIIAGLQHNNYTVLSPPYDDPDEIEMKMNKDAHIPDIINNSIKKKTSGSE